MSAKKSVAILVAAGQGERLANFTAGKPKQFIELNRIPLFVWSLSTLVRHSAIDHIIVVVPRDWQQQAAALVQQFLSEFLPKITIIEGGKTRQESVCRALEKIDLEKDKPVHVLIHDAARPFITSKLIDAVFLSLEKHPVVTAGIPLADSIKSVADDTVIADLDRRSFVLVQTPQAAQLSLWLAAHRQAKLQEQESTDDASIARAYGAVVFVVAGNKLNFKITDSEDFLVAQALVKSFDWSVGNISIAADCQ